MNSASGVRDTGEHRVGRVRLPTPREQADPDRVFHASSVLEVKANSAVLPPLERHVAGLIDGFRPVARLRKKSGLSSDELLDALRGLRARGLLVVTGVIEEAPDLVPALSDDVTEGTIPRGANDVIPPHVMREIQVMLKEEEYARRSGRAPADGPGFEDEVTTEAPPPEE